jgi:hypothetical protein
LKKFFKGKEKPERMRGGFSWATLPKPWNIICYAIMWYITSEDHFQILYYYHFPILNHFRNLDHLSFPYLLLHLLEDGILKARRKHEEGKTFYFIHQGLMNKIYTQHLSLNPPLLINPLASVTPQASLHPGSGPSHRKFKKTPALDVKINTKVNLIEPNLDIRQGKKSTRSSNKCL